MFWIWATVTICCVTVYAIVCKVVNDIKSDIEIVEKTEN
jgi:hypothetical protein